MRPIRHLAVVAALAGTLASGAAQAALRAPPGYYAAPGKDAVQAKDCPRGAVPYVGRLDFPSKYEGSDKARDDVNKAAEKRYRAETAPITEVERAISRQVGEYLDSGSAAALGCVVDLLDNWATAHALEGPATTHTGMSVRKWALASLASSYLRLKLSAARPLDRHAKAVGNIEAWFGRLAERVVDEWRDQPLKKMNNHEYWAAWAVLAAGVALDRRELFDWGVEQYRIAASQVDREGYLPNELRRDTRALFYHSYALTPLAMIAAFGKANGLALAQENNGALQRLARRVLTGVADPDGFEEKTGKRQLTSEFKEASKWAWMEPYCWTVGCDAAMQARLEALRPLGSTRLGGNVSDLFSGLERTRSAFKEVKPWIPQIARH